MLPPGATDLQHGPSRRTANVVYIEALGMRSHHWCLLHGFARVGIRHFFPARRDLLLAGTEQKVVRRLDVPVTQGRVREHLPDEVDFWGRSAVSLHGQNREEDANDGCACPEPLCRQRWLSVEEGEEGEEGEEVPYPYTGKTVKKTPMMAAHAQSLYVNNVGCPSAGAGKEKKGKKGKREKKEKKD